MVILSRDLAALVVPRRGGCWPRGTGTSLTGWLDPDGAVVEAVTAYFRDLLAAGGAASTIRSYGLDLLRWFRFLWAGSGVAWDRATRVEARDFSRWLQVAGKQSRPHWRTALAAGTAAPAGAGEATRRWSVRIRRR